MFGIIDRSYPIPPPNQANSLAATPLAAAITSYLVANTQQLIDVNVVASYPPRLVAGVHAVETHIIPLTHIGLTTNK